MSYGKYGFKKTGGSSSAEEMALNDPMFALGQLIAQNWSKNYEDRGIKKAVDEYGVDSLFAENTTPTKDQIQAASDVVSENQKIAGTNNAIAGVPTGVQNFQDPGTPGMVADAMPAFKQAAAVNATTVYGNAQQAANQTVFGNIDTSKIAPVDNGDGTYSTVRSKSFNIDGKEVLIPTVVNGKVVGDEEALDNYRKTGNNLGVFNTVDEANAAAQNIHNVEQKRIDNMNKENGFDADVFLAGQVAKMQKAGMDSDRIKQVVELISPQAYAKQKQINEKVMGGLMESYDKAIKTGRETGDFSEAFSLIPQIEKRATPETKKILLGGFPAIADANAKFVADKSLKEKRVDKQQDKVDKVDVYSAEKNIDLEVEKQSLFNKYEFFKNNPDAINYFSTSGKTGSSKKSAGSDGLFGTDYKAAMEIMKDLKDYGDDELSPAQKSMKSDAQSIIKAHFDTYFKRDDAPEKSVDEIANSITSKLGGVDARDKDLAINQVTSAIKAKYPAEKADAIIAKINAGAGGGGSEAPAETGPSQADYDKQAAYENQQAYENNVKTITYDEFVKMPLAERKEKFDTYLWPVVKMQQDRALGGR